MFAYYELSAEDRRALERVFYDTDRGDSSSESSWSSYNPAYDEGRARSAGSRGSGMSVAGRHRKESNEHDAQPLVDVMGLVRIGADRDRDSSNSRDDIAYSSRSTAAAEERDRVVRHPNHVAPYRHSHDAIDYDYEGKRAAVPGNVGERALSDSQSSSWRSESSNLFNYGSAWHAMNESFHERDTLRRMTPTGRHYSTQGSVYETYRGSVSPTYRYGRDSYNYDYDDDYDDGSESELSSESSSILLENYDVASCCGSIISDDW